MTIHFAAARNSKFIPVTRIAANAPPIHAANDNGLDNLSEPLLHVALRYFAKHGIGAARQAHDEAKEAFFAGDREAYDRMMAICRMLDKYVARQLVRDIVGINSDGHSDTA